MARVVVSAEHKAIQVMKLTGGVMLCVMLVPGGLLAGAGI